MSMDTNYINSYLNTFVQNHVSKVNKSNSSNKNSSGTAVNKSGVDDNIFAVASAVVSDYKSKQEENDNSSSSTSGKSFMELANMSTEEFKSYASSNEARSAYDAQKNGDSTGIKLPMLVRYKAEVFSTSGKTFMQVVAKIKGKYPQKSEEDIAATLMSKYATEEQISTIGKKYAVEYAATTAATQKQTATGNKISFNA
ncbi:MAG: hypothetical protein K6A44_00395 [bacterium]|nr:hypothetical protein [bacterium]